MHHTAGPNLETGCRKAVNLRGFLQRGHIKTRFLISGILAIIPIKGDDRKYSNKKRLEQSYFNIYGRPSLHVHGKDIGDLRFSGVSNNFPLGVSGNHNHSFLVPFLSYNNKFILPVIYT